MKPFQFILFLSLLTLFVSCDNDSNSKSDRTIHIIGSERNSSIVYIAKYWKDGKVLNLSDGSKNEFTTDVFVYGNDVYVAGFERNIDGTNQIAKYWKNGVEVLLADGTYDTSASAIVVEGNDVYVSGYKKINSNNPSINKAIYWKNGVEYLLEDDGNSTTSISMVKKGEDIFIAGTAIQFTPNLVLKSRYWKNGILVNLEGDETNFSQAFGLDINDNGDVLVCGLTGDYAKYWTNGVGTDLESDYRAKAITISASGNDIHIAGIETKPNSTIGIAKYWKNGVGTYLTNGENFAGITELKVFDNDVYVTGYETTRSTGYEIAKYWKNGVEKKLTDGTSNCRINGIFIQKL